MSTIICKNCDRSFDTDDQCGAIYYQVIQVGNVDLFDSRCDIVQCSELPGLQSARREVIGEVLFRPAGTLFLGV